MTWGRAWGDAWGESFGDGAGDPVVITGTGQAHQAASTASGTGHVPGGAVVRVAPDAYPGGVPSAKFARDAAERNGFILQGAGQADQPSGTAHGVARIKLVALVATGASVAHGAGETTAMAEFRDVELEMIAMLLAA